jgi:hypothetical protein
MFEKDGETFIAPRLSGRHRLNGNTENRQTALKNETEKQD